MTTQLTTLLARQPIFDTERNVKAYELLFRAGDNTSANLAEDAGDNATSTVFSNLFAGVEHEELLGNVPAFINFTRNILLQNLPLSSDYYVVEVLEDTKVDEALLHSLTTYKQQGVKIALDDFVITSETSQLLPYADYVKVDVMTLSPAEVLKTVAFLKAYPVTLLAEKVENYQVFEFCRKLGFTLFQGYFLCKPENIKGKRLDSNRLVILELLKLAQNDNVGFKDLAHVIDKDPNLSIKLIKLVNSPFYRRARTIESIQQAITMLGLVQIKKMITMLSLASLDDKPDELVTTALARANMLEQLASAVKLPSGPLFLAGILSLMDAFMDRPLHDLIDRLSVADELKSAILDYQGPMGQLLKATVLFEQAQWQKIDWIKLEQQGITPETMRDAYFYGLQIARQITKKSG
ncbi:HDOD domain-containing protein [Aestuariirhabdus sp. Z084]|uniref:EAL and HDOD domain-containing protein n=1 Tax=Aestuariirhabdus haliotis TaxID=2918751 RepID=UPI00201B4352|nr:HDOD domain-containing protein [Aestuariirhabdus haliotis]MCL6414740.1 HDOD domain-containing protein [Aestuariirhabdus haliotis]MCL6418672.1 HDOD domain-containing protein [Aestuariirhabdus haliotis]